MKLCLFFSYNVSLKTWVETGLLGREILIYEKYLKEGIFSGIYWLTYGSNDAALADELKSSKQLPEQIRILDVPAAFNHKVGRFVYSWIAPLIHRRTLKRCDVFKTNQIEGAWTAVLAKTIFHKKLLVRCGYVWSLFIRQQKRRRLLDWINPVVEPRIFKNADAVTVSSQEALDYIVSKYDVSHSQITVVSNYIDTARFKPLDGQKVESNRFVFVGRLHAQKNLFHVIEAFSRCKMGLDIYGEGMLEDGLRNHARQLDADVRFKGVVKNRELPVLLNRYTCFILASEYEGMPKSLLEAMACGLVCLATDVAGSREVIEDGVNGYLIADTSVEAIERVVRRVAGQDHAVVRRVARHTIMETYSLESVFNQERDVISRLITAG